ncbi:MAG: glycosyltransferase family 9 protein [bacterium]
MSCDPDLLKPQAILLIQLRAIGDVILTTPALRVLKRRFPDAAIDFLTNLAPAEALQGNPNLRETIVFQHRPSDFWGILRFAWKLRRRRYDITIDFLGTSATALISYLSGAPMRVGYNLRFRRFLYTHLEQGYRGDVYNALTKFSLLKPLGIVKEETETELFIPAEADKWAEDWMAARSLTDGRLVALAPDAKRPARRWLPERFAETATWLVNEGAKVLFFWGPGEREYVENVRRLTSDAVLLTPPMTLQQCAALLKRCRLLICNCSGIKHIAVAVGAPTLTLHGPTDPRVWTPWFDPKHNYIQANVDCLVCGKRECEPLDCMRKISAKQVIQRVQGMDWLWS